MIQIASPITNSISIIPTAPSSLAVYDRDLEKRINMFWLILALPSTPVTFLFGLYTFARSVFDVYKDCKDGIHLDCLFHGIDAVVAVAFGVYKFRSG